MWWNSLVVLSTRSLKFNANIKEMGGVKKENILMEHEDMKTSR